MEFIFFLIWFVVMYLLGVRLENVKPDITIRNKYSKKIRLQSFLPFASKWETKINKEDIKVFRKYRRRVLVFIILFWGSIFLFNIYLYVIYI